MSASVPFFLSTANTTNLTRIPSGAGLAANLKGWSITNTAAYAIFVKLYWAKDGVIPTVGTTVPQLVITCPAAATSGGGTAIDLSDGCTGNGPLFMWVTKLAAVSDTTVVVAGDGLVTLFVE